jgi:hypothetical protein
MKNDIKNCLDKTHYSLYIPIPDDDDVVIIYSVFFSGNDIPKPIENNSVTVNYYMGILSMINMHTEEEFFYRAAFQNHIPSLNRLIQLHTSEGNYNTALVYDIILNNLQSGLSYVWNYLKNNLELSIMFFKDQYEVTKVLGDFYTEQHNYEYAVYYYNIAKSAKSMFAWKQLSNDIKNYYSNQDYNTLKEFNNDNPERLNEIKKHYDIEK